MQSGLALVLVGLAAVAACGGADEEDLYGGGGAGGAGASGAAGMSGSGGAGGGEPADAGSDAPLDTSSGGGAGADDASADAVGEAGQAGTGGGGGEPGVGTGPCNGPLCDFAGGQVCCVAENTGSSCIAASQPCTCGGILCDSVRVHCDGPEDCAGKLCCAEQGLTSDSLDQLVCRTSCASDFVGTKRREVCHPGGVPCKNGSACEPIATLPPGYALCAPDP